MESVRQLMGKHTRPISRRIRSRSDRAKLAHFGFQAEQTLPRTGCDVGFGLRRRVGRESLELRNFRDGDAAAGYRSDRGSVVLCTLFQHTVRAKYGPLLRVDWNAIGV